MASYRSHSGTTYGSRTNTTITAPSGIQDGDELLLYFLMGATGSGGSGIPTPTWPSGFSVIEGPTTVGEAGFPFFSVRSWLLRKRASGESGNYTISHSSASSDGIIACVQNGADATHDATANDGDGNGNITFTGLTTSAADAWIGAFCHNWQLWGAGTTPNGTTPTFTERQDSSGSIIYFAEGTWASSGSTGSPTKDSDNNAAGDQWAAMLVAVENAASGTTHEKSYSETVGSSNPYSRLSNALRRPTDTSGASNPFSRKSDALRTYSESSASSDTIARLSNALRVQSDTVASSDAYARLADSLRAYQESGGVADAYDRLADGNRSLAENLGSTEAYERLSDALRVYSESQGHTDTFARQSDALRAVADTLGLAEAFEYTKALALAVSELLAFTDAYSRQSDASRSLADTAGLVDAYARVADTKRALAESSGLVEAYARLADGNRVFSESLGSTEAYARISNALRAFSDLLGLLDSVTLEASSPPANTLLTDLVSYWPLDEESGTRADAHGSNDLTDNNTVGFATGKISNAADFERTSTESLSCALNDLVASGNSFTLTCWLNAESLGAFAFIVSEHHASNGNGWALVYDDSAARFRVQRNLSSFLSANNLGAPSTATWYFVVVWHDVDATEYAIQVNNGTPDTATVGANPGTGTSSTFCLGDLLPAGGEGWDGLIDEVGFWTRVLTEDERSSLYNGGDGLPYSEFGGGATTYEITVTELLGILDAISRVSDAMRSLSDTTGVSEAYARLSDGLRVVTESAGLTDAYSRLSDALRDPAESLGATDTYSRLSDANRVSSESAGLSDAYARQSDGLRALSDTTGLSDAYARQADALRALADLLGLADAVDLDLIAAGVLTISVAESLGGLDAYARIASALRALSDTVGHTDAYARLADSLRSFADTAGLSDTQTISAIWGRPLSDTTGLSDAYQRQAASLRAVVESVGLLDTYDRLSNSLRIPTESLGITESYSRVADAIRLYNDVLGILDDPLLDLISAVSLATAFDIIGRADTTFDIIGSADTAFSIIGRADTTFAIVGDLDMPYENDAITIYRGEDIVFSFTVPDSHAVITGEDLVAELRLRKPNGTIVASQEVGDGITITGARAATIVVPSADTDQDPDDYFMSVRRRGAGVRALYSKQKIRIADPDVSGD